MNSSSTKNKAIRVENLSKFYGKTLGVNNISFDVDPGEIFGFLGPNGAGKTTTIRLLLDLLKPDEGSITIFGKPLNEFSMEIRRHCGYLPGEFQAYKHLTGYQYLGLFADLRKSQNDDLSILLEKFQLSPRDLKRKTSQYSRGMMQKLGIVQAFLHKPKLVILDEPTSGLDPLMQEVFYALIFEKQMEGTTIFFSSHNLPEVEKLCSRLAIIRQGQIVSVESIESLKQKVGHVMEILLDGELPALEIEGADLISAMGNRYVFKIKGDLSKVLQKVSGLPLKDITITRPTLEKVFMEFYKTS